MPVVKKYYEIHTKNGYMIKLDTAGHVLCIEQRVLIPQENRVMLPNSPLNEYRTSHLEWHSECTDIGESSNQKHWFGIWQYGTFSHMSFAGMSWLTYAKPRSWGSLLTSHRVPRYGLWEKDGETQKLWLNKEDCGIVYAWNLKVIVEDSDELRGVNIFDYGKRRVETIFEYGKRVDEDK